MKRAASILLLGAAVIIGACEKRPSPKSNPSVPSVASVLPDIEVPYKQLGWENDLYMWQGKPFTGRTVDLYKNGQIRMSIEVRDGRNDGWTREFYEDGKKKVECEFRAGRRHGRNTYWNPDGSVLKEQRWENDELKEDSHPQAE